MYYDKDSEVLCCGAGCACSDATNQNLLARPLLVCLV